MKWRLCFCHHLLSQASHIYQASTVWQPMADVLVEWSIVPMGGTWTCACEEQGSAVWGLKWKLLGDFRRKIEYLQELGEEGRLEEVEGKGSAIVEKGEPGDQEGWDNQSVGKGETEWLRVLCNVKQSPRLLENLVIF